MISRFLLRLLTLFAPLALAACGTLFGDLRKDLDDRQAETPVTGGMWPEAGQLEQEEKNLQARSNQYGQVGHNDRRIASVPSSMQSYYGENLDNTEDQLKTIEKSSKPPSAIFSDTKRATKSDFLDNSPDEGSLWASRGQTNYYFTKNRIRSVGDLISVKLEKEFIRDVQAEFVRTMDDQERKQELSIAQDNLKTQAIQEKSKNRAPAAAGAKDKPAENEDVEVRKATLEDVELDKALEIKEGDSVMAEVLERYPNGNYKIRGVKRIPYRGGVRTLTVLAVAKGATLADSDELPSGSLYEYRLQFFR